MRKSKNAPVDDGSAEIEAIAYGRKFPTFELPLDLMQEVQMSWALFVEHKGGLEEAEESVKRALQKVDPHMSTLMYGDEARPHADENSVDAGRGLMFSKSRGMPETINYDGPEGRRRMAAIVRAGQPHLNRNTIGRNEPGPGGPSKAVHDVMGKIAAPTMTEASKSQVESCAKSKAQSKSRARPAQQNDFDLGSVGSMRSSGPGGSVESLLSSGPGLTEASTDGDSRQAISDIFDKTEWFTV